MDYTPKQLSFGDEGRHRLIDGISKLSEAVKSTLGPSGNTVLIESQSHTSGMTVTKDELFETGERIYTLERMFNYREAGYDRKDDRIPDRSYDEPTKDGFTGIKGGHMNREKFQKLLDEYYELHGWDKNGLPTPETIKKLKLKSEPAFKNER